MNLKTPIEWSEIYGVKIMDPDGWRIKDAPSWDVPINAEEWEMRLGISTIDVVDQEKYNQAWVDHSY